MGRRGDVTRDPDPGPLFDLILYLVSCSRLSLEEPTIYGSFRLIEGAARVIEALDPEGADGYLSRTRTQIEQNKLLMIDEPQEYQSWLDGLLRQIVAEAKLRQVDQRSRAESAARRSP
jgi:hypothetical protein